MEWVATVKNAVCAVLTVIPNAGDYNKDKVAPNSRLAQDVPQFQTQSNIEGCTVITHREYIADILSATGFSMQQALPINPGTPATFPWLAKVAQNYAQYRFRSLIFTFKSMSGALSTTQALGEIIMAANYNVYEANFTNKLQMLNEIFSESKVPSEDAMCAIECAPNQTTNQGLMMIRGNAIPAGQDKRFYDLANFYIASNGQASANITLGELWVSYVVELYKPQLDTIGISPASDAVAHYQCEAYTDALPFHGHTAIVDNIGLTVTDKVITFPADLVGTFSVFISWRGSSAATIAAPTFTGSAGATRQAILNGNSNSQVTSPLDAQSSATLIYQAYYFFDNTGANAGVPQTISITATGTLPASGIHCDLFICPAINIA